VEQWLWNVLCALFKRRIDDFEQVLIRGTMVVEHLWAGELCDRLAGAFYINECPAQYFTPGASGDCHVKNTSGVGGADASRANTVIFTGSPLFEVF